MEKDSQPVKTELQQLIDSIDRNGEDWPMILHWRDVIQRKFLKNAMSDMPNELDSEEFNDYLDHASKCAHDILENPESLTEEEIKIILVGILSSEWDKKAEIVQANIELGSQAIKHAKDSIVVAH